MGKFKIEVHDRLQEWVAEERGYFKDEGLDYEFVMHGPGERIVFEPYTREMYDRAVKWMASWNLGGEIAAAEYERAAYGAE